MTSPARRPERLNVLAFNVVGLLTITGSWYAASDQVRMGPQLSALNAAVAGVILMVVASGLHLVAFRRAIKERSAHLSARMDGSAR